MPLQVNSRYIDAAESKLRLAFPPAYRNRITMRNGGEIEFAAEPWFLHPISDDSDFDRLRRSWDDVVRQTEVARRWCGFPQDAVSIADNGGGDRLILVPGAGSDAAPVLARWDHETGAVELAVDVVEVVFASP